MNRRSIMFFVALLTVVVLPVLSGIGAEPATGTEEKVANTGTSLRSPTTFASIEDSDQRSAAIFEELGKVLQHPRCVNCHPSGDAPRQGDESTAHQPVVSRGSDGFGMVGMRCGACHQGTNFDPGRIPGAPHWHLAPRSMAWEGLSKGEICEQLKDPERNGGRDLEAIVKHMRDDPLVGWAWDPGTGREAAPGTQEQFGALLRAWVDAGAACP